MPERIFAYQTVPELLALIKDLSGYLVYGATNQIRNNHTGFLKTTGNITQADMRARLMDVRYEIYLRGREGDQNCFQQEPKDPRKERIMKVRTVRGSTYFNGDTPPLP